MNQSVIYELIDSADALLTNLYEFGVIEAESSNDAIIRLARALSAANKLAPKETCLPMDNEELSIKDKAIDKDAEFSILLTIDDVSSIYKKNYKKECSARYAKQVIKELKETFSRKLSIEQQCKTIMSSMSDENIDAILQW